MEPTKYDFTCKAGTTWRKSFRLKDRHQELVDLTGYTARMQVREAIDADTALVSLATAEGIPEDPGDDLWGEITIDVAQARVTLYIAPEVTTEFAVGSYVYDVELVDADGEVMCPLYGKIKVSGEVTR